MEGYWETWWDTDDVFYGHVLGCKGLERRVVVLCVNEDEARDRSRERLYVGMSRATDLLVVVGDPRVIRACGGAQVDRQSVVWGKSVSVRVGIGGGRIMKKKT